MSRVALVLMWLAHFLPLRAIAAIGGAVGGLAFWLIPERRRVTRINLAKCFPQMAPDARERIARDHFRAAGRSIFDLGIVWWAPRERVEHLVRIEGLEHLRALGATPSILLAPHFVGADIGGSRLGAEVNMVSQMAVLEKAVRAAGLELKAVAANSPSEVGDAALALVAAHVDAICQLPGNLTVAAFPSIAQAARRARVPVFGFQSSQSSSAVLTVARDYYDSGREAARMAARIMRGESPAVIPFVGFTTNRIIVNRAAARTLGLTPPADIVAKAQKVIDE